MAIKMLDKELIKMWDKEFCEKMNKVFKDNKARFYDYGNIKILEYKKDDTQEDMIRYIFEEDTYTLHISGDYGCCDAVNYKNMTFESFYMNYCDGLSEEYFMQKVRASSVPLSHYDFDKFWEGIRDKLIEVGSILEDTKEREYFCDCENKEEEKLFNIKEELYNYFEEESGLNWDKLNVWCPDVYDEVAWLRYDGLGLEQSEYCKIWLYAFKLAWEELILKGESIWNKKMLTLVKL